jgi:endonuclease YncB( thermonuclease family)
LALHAPNRIEPGAIEAIDGDTIRANGQTVRLVGFDAPEAGNHARCESERTLAARATFRLRQLVSVGGLELQLIACSCRPGTRWPRPLDVPQIRISEIVNGKRA